MFAFGYVLIAIACLFNQWSSLRLPIALFIGAKCYGIGFYHLMEFEADPSVILPFETEFRRDERIIRFLTTKMDKHHIAYAEGRRDKSNRQEAAPAEAEGSAEA